MAEDHGKSHSTASEKGSTNLESNDAKELGLEVSSSGFGHADKMEATKGRLEDKKVLDADASCGTLGSDSGAHEEKSERIESGKDDEDDSGQLGLRSVLPANVSIKNLSVKLSLEPSAVGKLPRLFEPKTQRLARPKFKAVLDGVSALMPQGSITAILGASGSGKTSLLNTLARRMNDGRLKNSGEVLYNGSPKPSKIRSAYVMQQDVLIPTLTVRETLHYAAELRLPPPTTANERRSIVEEVILELGLRECAETRIGNNEHKGCSGGEKRRTSLGVQLLSNPSVLFLDEVTTGLDATSAFQLVKTLKELARRGRTIITTIHQPRSEIWGLFDHIILLSKGSPVYSGLSSDCIAYFDRLGYPLPPFVNPAEHLIDLAAMDTRTPELEAISSTRVEALKTAWRSTRAGQEDKDFNQSNQLESESVIKSHAGFIRQVRIQTARSLKTTYRDPMGMAGILIEAVTMAIMTGWVFVNLDGSLSGIRSREGALYVASALQGYLILLFETYRLTLDIGVFDRERAEGVVGAWSFLISRRLSRLFIEDIPVPLIYSLIFYFMAGFRHVTTQFFTFFAIVLLGQYLAVSFAMVAVSISRDFAGASLIGNINFTLQSMCSGFFVQSNQIPIWVRWLKYTAYVWYANGALVTNEFIGHSADPAGQLYDCPYPGGTSNPACIEYTGAFVVDSLGYPRENWIWRPVVILMGFIGGYFIISGLIFTFFKADMRISRSQNPTLDTSLSKEQLETHSRAEARTLQVDLDQLSLDIQKHSLFTRKSQNVSILKPITAKFEPGILNVIMGVSGGGKTSLLNLMACRLSSSYSTRYQSQGRMLFGGSVPNVEVIRSVASYVSQTDDALLPTLTVRETLYFAAQLRLPSWMAKDEKTRRAEVVLMKLGLRDCANNLVGNDLVKGISGGEKRRVSIGIQILTDPRILLLDEPTSGLDAFTASSILDVLRGLAEEGRTIILTIHQSRSDLFQHFGNILLLAKGGHMIFSGPAKRMLAHFSSLGHDCPENVNPADYALDLISVDLKSSQKEARSREKVRSLIVSWTDEQDRVARTISHISAPAELGSFKRKMTPFWIAAPLLIQRSFISFRRNTPAIMARTTQVIAFGCIVTLFFAPLKSDYDSIQSRLGFIQEFLAIYFVGMLQNVAVYPAEKMVFYNEYADGTYSPESFFVCYTVLEVPFEIITSLIFAALTVYAAGLPRSVTVYFVVAFDCFAIVNCGESVGIMFNTFFASTGFAVNVTSVVLSLSLLMSGIISTNLASFLQAFNHLSPGKWVIGNLAPYTLQGVMFSCSDAQKLPNGKCPIETGQQVLQLYNLETNANLNLVAVAVALVVYRFVAFLVLKVVLTKWKWSAWKGKGKGKGKIGEKPSQ